MSNILNRKNDYKFQIFKTDLHIISFDDVIIIYARDNILFNEIE